MQQNDRTLANGQVGHMVGAADPNRCEDEKTCVLVLTLIRFVGWFGLAGLLVKLKWRWIL